MTRIIKTGIFTGIKWISSCLFFETFNDPEDTPVKENRANTSINIDIPFVNIVHPGFKVECKEGEPEDREEDRHTLPAGEFGALFLWSSYWRRLAAKPFREYKNSQDNRNNN
jgi:hypothetical protein